MQDEFVPGFRKQDFLHIASFSARLRGITAGELHGAREGNGSDVLNINRLYCKLDLSLLSLGHCVSLAAVVKLSLSLSTIIREVGVSHAFRSFKKKPALMRHGRVSRRPRSRLSSARYQHHAQITNLLFVPPQTT
jgi:hypothetical protein